MKRFLVPALVLVATLGLTAFATSGGKTAGPKAARAAKAIAGQTFSIVAAVQAAERHTGGVALEAEVEIENGKAVVEVEILKGGAVPQLLEVEIDGATNEILEVEDEDEEEDDDDDDQRR